MDIRIPVINSGLSTTLSRLRHLDRVVIPFVLWLFIYSDVIVRTMAAEDPSDVGFIREVFPIIQAYLKNT